MNNRAVLFLDSGVGGIPYAKDFLKRNPSETVCYLADRENFPYGPRSKDEISAILISLTEKLIEKIDPKIIVVACNTASISALDPLRKRFTKLSFVGTVPAVKPAANASKTGKVGILGTERTIEDIRSLNLAANCQLIGIAAPQLAEFVEMKFETSNPEERLQMAKKYVEMFREAGADVIVLGCTHFLYLLEEFRYASTPSIKTFDSLEGITKRVEYLLDENDGFARAEKNSKPAPRLILTGNQAPDPFWEKRAKALGFNLCLLSDV